MQRLVFVVDDDDRVRRSSTRLLNSAGYAVRDFASGNAFLEAALPQTPTCLILDMKMPNASGFDVVDALAQRGEVIPVIVLTGHGSIPMTVRAMKAGVREFLTKPVAPESLLAAVEEALVFDEQGHDTRRELAALAVRYRSLTPREREIFSHAAGGLLTKQIAAELGISEITVKVHKRKVMEKMHAKSVADLGRSAERLHIASSGQR